MLTDHVVHAYDALHQTALAVDRSDRRRIRMVGSGAAEVLNGLVSNDVVALQPGAGLFAAALTAKGKLIADLRIFRLADHLLFDTGARAGDGLWAMIRKYVNPRLTKYEDVTDRIADLSVFGPRAADVVSAATGLDADALRALAPYGHLPPPVDDQEVIVARIPDLAVDGYALLTPIALIASLRDRVHGAGAMVAESKLPMEIARVEAGRPEWGIDVDDNTLLQEANFDELQGISYTKGCYTGQETVARLHFRGHVNRLLRGVDFEARFEPPGVGLELRDAGGHLVGALRSATRSPRLGGIGIAMLRREIAAGDVVEGVAGDEPIPFTVRRLPYQVA